MQEPNQGQEPAAEGLSPAPEAPRAQEAQEVAPPPRGNRLWRDWVRPFLIILLVVGSFRSAVADWNDVPTGSMIPTILGGDRIFVNKTAYSLRVPFTRLHLVEWAAPQRGDIVVFFSPSDSKRLVKRVVGLPGDRLELRSNRLIVNGKEAIYEAFAEEEKLIADAMRQQRGDFLVEELGELEHPITLSSLHRRVRNYGPLTVPEGHYFVMGDNRDNSRDSRWFGAVPRELIVGQATAVAFSLDRDRGFVPRWYRFFQKLD